MTENNKNLGIDGFDPSKVNKLSAKEILKRVGPGIVLTGVVIGPGNITTSAMIGANYGYSLIWLIIPILIMGVTFMLTSYRISMLTGMPILHAIRHYYGKVASGFCGVALFLSCLSERHTRNKIRCRFIVSLESSVDCQCVPGNCCGIVSC